MALKRATYEQSPVALFLDFQLPQMIAANQARERSMQHEMAMEDKRAERQMNLEAYRANEQRLTNLQDQFIEKGLKVKPEFQTSGYSSLSKEILNSTKDKSKALLDSIQQGDTQIAWMQDQLAEQRAGEILGQQIESGYLSAGQTAEDVGVDRFMLEGGFKQDEDGLWVASDPESELGKLLTDLKTDDPATLAKFSSEAFRKGFDAGRYDNTLVAERQSHFNNELAAMQVQQEIKDKNYERAQARIEEAKGDIQDDMRYYGHGFTGTLNIAGHSFGMIQMLEDIGDQEKVFEDFQEMINDGKMDPDVGRLIMDRISSFSSSVKDPEANPHEYFTDMVASAYDDILAYSMLKQRTELDPNDVKYIDMNNLTNEQQKIVSKATSWYTVGIGHDLDRLRRAKEIQIQYKNLGDLEDEKTMAEIGLDSFSAQSLRDKIPYDQLPEVDIDKDDEILKLIGAAKQDNLLDLGDSELNNLLQEAKKVQDSEIGLKETSKAYQSSLTDLLHGMGGESNKHIIDEMIVQGLLPGIPRGQGLPQGYIFSDEALAYFQKRIKQKAGHYLGRADSKTALGILEEWNTFASSIDPYMNQKNQTRQDQSDLNIALDLFKQK